jgi:hypothetical protein
MSEVKIYLITDYVSDQVTVEVDGKIMAEIVSGEGWVDTTAHNLAQMFNEMIAEGYLENTIVEIK